MIENLSEIRKLLQIGDYRTIAEAAEVSRIYVRKVLNGERKAETKKAKDIIRLANQLIYTRRQLMQGNNT